MKFTIFEDVLEEAGFPLNEDLELTAKIEDEHMLLIGPDGDITVKIYPEEKEHMVEIPDNIVYKIQFDDSTYEHPCPAYIHATTGEIGLIFP